MYPKYVTYDGPCRLLPPPPFSGFALYKRIISVRMLLLQIFQRNFHYMVMVQTV